MWITIFFRFVSSVSAAYLVMSILGVAVSIRAWAPFAVLGEAIYTESNSSPSYVPLIPSATPDTVEVYGSLNPHHQDPLEHTMNTSDDNIGPSDQQFNKWAVMDDEAEPFVPLDDSGAEATMQDKAGTIFGIQNVFIVTSQLLATGFTSILFALTDAGSQPFVNMVDNQASNTTLPDAKLIGDVSHMAQKPFDSVGLLFRLGGICAAVASYMCWRLSRQLQL